MRMTWQRGGHAAVGLSCGYYGHVVSMLEHDRDLTSVLHPSCPVASWAILYLSMTRPRTVAMFTFVVVRAVGGRLLRRA